MSATKENLPAIIPVSGMASEFGMEWDSSLIPVGPNYTAIEATIYECLHVGCNSIWIIANDDIAPLLRKRIGEYATDIRSLEQASFKQFGSDHHKEVPIYYVPIHPKHRNKVDNYAWSAIYGANVAFWIMRGFSRWTTPAAYYVSFPLGMMDPKELLKHRAKVQKKKTFYFSHEGRTVRDGHPISFVMEPDEWRRAKHTITTNASMWKAPAEGELPTELLPPEQRLVSLRYELEDVFGDGPTTNDQEINLFYDLTTWPGYVKFISSELGSRTKRPGKNVMYRRGKINDG
jgi:hypothetical protein